MNKILLYFHTLKHIKFIQLYYQVYYRFLSRFFKTKLDIYFKTPLDLDFTEGITAISSFSSSSRFSFLNLEQKFETIDWNFSKFGKLWTYNLNYFDFLNQKNITKQEGLQLIEEFCAAKETHKDGYEPYPISLRGINWVKFLSQHGINNHEINQQLHNDFLRLNSKLEYHLLANHLIENAFSLLFGAYYFKDEKFYKKAKKILRSQLKEQILKDGGHYELSPMYHCIILHRILDSYNLVRNNHNWHNDELEQLLKESAENMLGWLKAIQFKGGDLPQINDTTIGIAPEPEILFDYAQNLDLSPKKNILKESGYRKIKTQNLELLYDVGQIAPSYQPGHSHADSLQVVVYAQGIPLIVDTGISTYEKNERRQLERSTASHNTVCINNQNSSLVWSGFRVAKRAKVSILEDGIDKIIASHNGYRSLGITCKREVETTDGLLRITDTVKGSGNNDLIQGHLHLHPDVDIQFKNNLVVFNKKIQLRFPKQTTLELKNYYFCSGFNDLVLSKKIIYTFTENITFTISPL